MISRLDIAALPRGVPDPEAAQALKALWQACGLTRPWNDPAADIALALAGEGSTILVGRVDARLVASTLVGHDGHRGTVYYVSVDPAHRGHGHGRALMAAAEAWLRARNVPKLNLMVRTGNEETLGFYRALGYEPQAVTVLGKFLS